jgi:acyl carrier protein
MRDIRSIIRFSLEQSGLGPTRIGEVLCGSQIFGATGILNSLELVHFVARLSEELDIDVFTFMSDLDITSSTAFQSIDDLSRFIEGKVTQAA